MGSERRKEDAPAPLRAVVGVKGLDQILECGHAVPRPAPQRRSSIHRAEPKKRRCERCKWEEVST